MKYFVIIAIIIILILGFSLWKMKQGKSCINLENYRLLSQSSHTAQLSKYKIIKEKDQLIFKTTDNYSLFFIKHESQDNSNIVELIGLDGYGLRDKEFNKYVCKLIDDIKREANK
jgi:hypothetical protein